MPFQVFRDPYELYTKKRPPLLHVTQETLKWANANSLFPPTLKAVWVFLRPTKIRTVKEL